VLKFFVFKLSDTPLPSLHFAYCASTVSVFSLVLFFSHPSYSFLRFLFFFSISMYGYEFELWVTVYCFFEHFSLAVS